MICAALLLSVPAAAQEPAEPTAAPAVVVPQADTTDFDIAKKKVVDCQGEKFVFAWGAGSNPTKVTLCSKKDATPREVVLMLDEAANKLENSLGIAEDRRIMIVKQIRAKISELQKVAEAGAPPPPAAAEKPVASALPSTPSAPAEFTPLPPLPRPIKPAAVAAPSLLGPKPRLSFECYTPGEIGSGGPCTILGRDTRLTIRARDALAGGASLRFVRNGESRAEVPLQQMRKGQSIRMILPQQLCKGVSEAEAKIEIMNGGRYADSIGPFLLRC
jgi:hypothetical protein